MPSRRDVLETVARSAVLAGTAGCLGSGPDGPRLDCVSATNDDAEAHAIHVIVEYEGERAAWETLDTDDRTPGRYLHVDLDIRDDGNAEVWVLALPSPDDQCEGAPVATRTPSDTG
jgi:hypothetical protein